MKKIGYVLLAGAVFLAQNAWTQNLISKNPGFEEGKAGWGSFLPGDSKDAKCSFDVVSTDAHSGSSCAKIDADTFARFCISGPGFTAKQGTRIRFTAWVKGDANAEAKPGTPGALFRIMLTNGGKNVPGGWAFFIGLGGKAKLTAMEKGMQIGGIEAPLPKEWSKVEAVFEIPKTLDGAEYTMDRLSSEFFTWYAKGTFYVDDFMVEEVDESVPLTTIQ